MYAPENARPREIDGISGETTDRASLLTLGRVRRAPSRWQTDFGRWVGDTGVPRIVAAVSLSPFHGFTRSLRKLGPACGDCSRAASKCPQFENCLLRPPSENGLLTTLSRRTENTENPRPLGAR